jgi:hypothetical protein
LQVRGGDEALTAIKTLYERFGYQALDTTKYAIMDVAEETCEGFTQWREYRDKVVHDREAARPFTRDVRDM